MRLLFLAQWGLALIREGTKCFFSSCLAVWGVEEEKEGRGQRESIEKVYGRINDGAFWPVSHSYSYLSDDVFERSKTIMQLWYVSFCSFIFLVFALFFPPCTTFPWQISSLSLSFSISSFSNQLQQLIFFIGHLDCSSLSSFTNQGPFVWKHITRTCFFWQPWEAILMLCLSVICVIDYKIGVNFKKRVFATFVVNYERCLYSFCC